LGGIAYQQGHRNLILGPDGTIYVLFAKIIARLDPVTFGLTMLAEPPVPVQYGGDYLDTMLTIGEVENGQPKLFGMDGDKPAACDAYRRAD